MKMLRVALLVQALFFAAWGAWLLRSHVGAQEIWLATTPVDPRDLISGTYVALGYDINRTESCRLPTLEAQSDVYVELVPSARSVTVQGRAILLWDATGCAAQPGSDLSSVWAHGVRNTQSWGGSWLFGIERFYVGEENPLRTVRSGDVVAKVAVNAAHQLRILDLVRIDR